ncbi:MAG TPA: cyclase family protein, partial [Gemmatimonadaceae bacterium]|nr:cyclase family protein [Gemmatimonadaceae bacterium]
VSRIYDISVPIRSGGIIYPGNPEVDITLQQAVARGAGANVSLLRFGSHTGTHADAARHFFDDGQPVDQIPLDRLIGPALLLSFSDNLRSVGAADLQAHDLKGHTRILLRTRNSALLSQEEFAPDYTYLAPDGAEYLVGKGVELVGIDYLSIEQFHSGHHRTHRTLLAKSVVILEGLDLSVPVAGEYQLICLPLRIEGCDGAPARAVLIA